MAVIQQARRCGCESSSVLDRVAHSVGYDHCGATASNAVPTMQDRTSMTEDCCWTWIRDHCPLKRSGKCDCECHTTYPEPPDWKSRAETAEAELAAAVAQVAALRAALIEIEELAHWVARRTAWNQMGQHVGSAPNADSACREIRATARAALAGLTAGGGGEKQD